jgi:hypothetical protein
MHFIVHLFIFQGRGTYENRAEMLRLIVDLVEASCYADNPEWRWRCFLIYSTFSSLTINMHNLEMRQFLYMAWTDACSCFVVSASIWASSCYVFKSMLFLSIQFCVCSVDDQVAKDILLVDALAERQAQIFSDECRLFPADVQVQSSFPV